MAESEKSRHGRAIARAAAPSAASRNRLPMHLPGLGRVQLRHRSLLIIDGGGRHDALGRVSGQTARSGGQQDSSTVNNFWIYPARLIPSWAVKARRKPANRSRCHCRLEQGARVSPARSKIRNPLYFDQELAKKKSAECRWPVTFLQTTCFSDRRKLRVRLRGFDLRRILHALAGLRILKPIFVGDT